MFSKSLKIRIAVPLFAGFGNKGYQIRFGNMTKENSGLLPYLHQHAIRPEFTIKVAWRTYTLTIWDNSAAQHFAINDYDGFRRELRRTNVKGELPLPA